MAARSLWPRKSSLIALLLFPLASIAGDVDQAPRSYYRAQSAEVRVTFFATDQDNQLVDPVREDDFAIVDEDTVVRNFRSFGRSDETGLDVIALVDSSESVSVHIEEIKKAMLQLVSGGSFVPNDNISIVTFSGKDPILLCAHSCGSTAATRTLSTLKADGPTPLFDALDYVASSFSMDHSPNLRRVVILFSDGHDTISRTSADDSLKSILASGALLYSVDLDDQQDPEGSSGLAHMAEITGGRLFHLRDGAIGPLKSALADLHASYTVSYQVPNRVVGLHSLRILPKHNLNLQFHCRRAYLYEASR